MNNGEKMTPADWALFGLALLLLLPPVLVIGVLNKGSTASFITSEPGRAYLLTYASFWLAAMAGLTAGRGVVRHRRGTPKVDLAEASIQDYIESALLLVGSACTVALTALDEPLPHRAFLWVLTVYPAVYAGYLVVLKLWEKSLVQRRKSVSIASAGLRSARWLFLSVATVTAAGLWIADWIFVPAMRG